MRNRRPPPHPKVPADPRALCPSEQESLIESLAAQNAERNAQFRNVLLVLPALASVPYLLALFRPPTTLLAVLALSSLGSTAYLLWQLPPAQTGIPLLDRWARGAGSDDAPAVPPPGTTMPSRRRRRSSLGALGQQQGNSGNGSPLETWLPLLNVGLCGMLVVMGLLVGYRDVQVTRTGVGIGNLPGLVLGVVLVAKVVMAGVDPETELGGLRYEYKGA